MSKEERKAKIDELEKRIFFIESADRMSEEERFLVWKLKAEVRELENGTIQ